MYLENIVPVSTVAEMAKVYPSTVYRWLESYENEGPDGLFVNPAVGFYPFKISGIQTDNHSTFTNRYTGYEKSSDPLNPRLHCFDLNCQKHGISHCLIDKGKPAQNGKVERFHRVCEEEFYQKEIFKDLNSARKKFRDFLYYFNNERENQGINNLTPLQKLQTFPQYEKIKYIA